MIMYKHVNEIFFFGRLTTKALCGRQDPGVSKLRTCKGIRFILGTLLLEWHHPRNILELL